MSGEESAYQQANRLASEQLSVLKEVVKKHMSDEVVVGDLSSNEVGSGARKNAGKLPMDLIPVSHWRELWTRTKQLTEGCTLDLVLCYLADWQEGRNSAIWHALEAAKDDWEDSVETFEFGAKKYARWNWAKGMAFSVPTGCILRHAKAIVDGQVMDADSDTTHMGCIVCNLHMLAWYTERYPQLDDRPIFNQEGTA